MLTQALLKKLPIKEIWVKNNLQGWFDAQIEEEIERWDKSLARFKKSRLQSDNAFCQKTL